MFGRKKKTPPVAEISEAREAQARAHAAIKRIDQQDPEVHALVRSLELRRIKNNFGDALVIAMEKRAT
jgi:hypothetical protein